MNASTAAAMSDEDRKLVQFLARVDAEPSVALYGELWIRTQGDIEDDAEAMKSLAGQEEELGSGWWDADFSRAPYWIYNGWEPELDAVPIRDISDLREYLERRGIEVDDLRV